MGETFEQLDEVLVTLGAEGEVRREVVTPRGRVTAKPNQPAFWKAPTL